MYEELSTVRYPPNTMLGMQGTEYAIHMDCATYVENRNVMLEITEKTDRTRKENSTTETCFEFMTLTSVQMSVPPLVKSGGSFSEPPFSTLICDDIQGSSDLMCSNSSSNCTKVRSLSDLQQTIRGKRHGGIAPRLKKRTSKYVGVGFYRALQKWQASICVHRKRKHLGYFATEDMAHEAYLVEASKINRVRKGDGERYIPTNELLHTDNLTWVPSLFHELPTQVLFLPKEIITLEDFQSIVNRQKYPNEIFMNAEF
jgi:hypothetical protein